MPSLASPRGVPNAIAPSPKALLHLEPVHVDRFGDEGWGRSSVERDRTGEGVTTTPQPAGTRGDAERRKEDEQRRGRRRAEMSEEERSKAGGPAGEHGGVTPDRGGGVIVGELGSGMGAPDVSRRRMEVPVKEEVVFLIWFSYASSQLDFFGHMSSPQIPQQSTSLEGMMKKLLDDQQRFHEELQQFSREFPSLQNLENQFIQLNATLQNMRDKKEWCNTQPTSYLEENVDVDTLSNVEENADTPMENYCRETTQGLEVLPIEPNMSIAPNDDDDDVMLEIGVISKRSKEPQIESKEDQPLVLVKPPTLPCIFDKPYTGVEVKECSQIFYNANTFVLEDHDVTDSFVLEVSNELPILKEGVHAALPKYVDAPFIVDISKGEGIT
ncbi:hypothetical protein Syun_014570 [Stephania yunnanensis]|uniref:Uncharacterized protein n=1 Tax=Stephania yunnanensis TaxID=152371 RepID=A0AAP0JLR6_9MAGN